VSQTKVLLLVASLLCFLSLHMTELSQSSGTRSCGNVQGAYLFMVSRRDTGINEEIDVIPRIRDKIDD